MLILWRLTCHYPSALPSPAARHSLTVLQLHIARVWHSHYTVTVTTKKTIINCRDVFTFLYLHYMIKNMIFPFVLLVVWILSKILRLSVSWSEHAQCAEQEQEVWLVIRVGEVDVEEEERYLVYFKVRSNLKSNNNVKFLNQSTTETNRWNIYIYIYI